MDKKIDILRIIGSPIDSRKPINHKFSNFSIDYRNEVGGIIFDGKFIFNFIYLAKKGSLSINRGDDIFFDYNIIKNIIQDYDSKEYSELEFTLKYGRNIFDDELLYNHFPQHKDTLEFCLEFILSIFSM